MPIWSSGARVNLSLQFLSFRRRESILKRARTNSVYDLGHRSRALPLPLASGSREKSSLSSLLIPPTKPQPFNTFTFHSLYGHWPAASLPDITRQLPLPNDAPCSCQACFARAFRAHPQSCLHVLHKLIQTGSRNTALMLVSEDGRTGVVKLPLKYEHVA